MKRYAVKRLEHRAKAQRRRRRTIKKVRFMMCLMLCAVSAALVLGGFSPASATKYRDTYELTVSSGDTLWDIARENNPMNKDIRSVVDDIIKLNKLTSAQLCAGDKITVPVY